MDNYFLFRQKKGFVVDLMMNQDKACVPDGPMLRDFAQVDGNCVIGTRKGKTPSNKIQSGKCLHEANK